MVTNRPLVAILVCSSSKTWSSSEIVYFPTEEEISDNSLGGDVWIHITERERRKFWKEKDSHREITYGDKQLLPLFCFCYDYSSSS